MLFRIVADAEFEADGLDDAFTKLASHFDNLRDDGLETPDIFIGGKVEVKRIEDYESSEKD